MKHEHQGIVMIPIEALVHHPDNPRKDMGDLKELIASIKVSGVMQNLTVVPNPNDEETWWVVIGNRRMEASKDAGLKELPCIISDMDHKTQVATMMAENMQRADLTVMEQAQGVQMMMDLGMDVSEISKRIGIRKDAVHRRALMLKYDAGKVTQAVAKGGTISDFADLEKVRDEKKRDELLGYIGTPNFRNHLKGALEDQRDWDNINTLAAKLETFATRIEHAGEVNGRTQKMLDVKRWHRPDAKMVEDYAIPKDVKKRRYYYVVCSYPSVELYVAVDSATEINSIEQEWQAKKDKLRNAYKAQWDRAVQIDKRHRELRIEFLKNSPSLKLDRDYLVAMMMDVCLQQSGYVNTQSKALLCDLLQVAEVGKWKDAWWRELLETRTAYVAACILLVKLDNGYMRPYNSEWCQEAGQSRPVHCRCPELVTLYEILQHIGYEMSDEEKAMMDGSHEVYRKYEEVEGDG